MSQNIHYDTDEAAFETVETPDVPGIEDYVPNWNKLSDRHQKRVALSVDPWNNFIPTMAATGHTHYIKPLREKLSECPDMETLKDHRIGLDSRLWDDVRGAGGYHTVTGIEDVERNIFKGYNTVLHELTHQVHGLFTDPEKRRIEETYRAAKTREMNGVKTFLTRYAASNEWEYFAEGVNSYYSPRRDEFDGRELVRERLFEMDTALVELVEQFTQVTRMEPYIIIGKVRAADELVERGRANEALNSLHDLPESSNDNRAVLHATSRISSILGEDQDAVEMARRAIDLFPEESEGYTLLSSALLHSNRETEKAIQLLTDAFERDDLDFPHRICLELGKFHHNDGNYSQAIKWCEEALKYQEDLPRAIWGLALAWGDSSLQDPENNKLFDKSLEQFRKVIPERSGVTNLRLDYARILMLHGDLSAAGEQIDEAFNLMPDDPLVWTYQGWAKLLSGSAREADELLQAALESDSTLDLPNILVAAQQGVETRMRLIDEIINSRPFYIYVPLKAAYEQRRIFPHWQRELLMNGVL